jgi:L-lysine 2,3-aminomutase
MEPEIPYRTPFTQFTPAASVSSTDENEFSTLRQTRDEFAEALSSLYTFNAFEVDKSKTPTERAKVLLHEVEINQGVYAILMPLFESLDSTVNGINQKYREQMNS